jgi:uncharacterized protein involved in exopolysaccharide biosynthesis
VNGSGRKPLDPMDIEASVRVLWQSWFVGVGILIAVWVVF